MEKKRPWVENRELAQHVISATVAFLITPLLAGAWQPLQKGASHYRIVEAVPAGLCFLAIGVLDAALSRKRQRSYLIPLSYLPAMLYVGLALLVTDNSLKAGDPLPTITVAMLVVVLVRTALSRFTVEHPVVPPEVPAVGIASAGVLALHRSNQSAVFLLVHNKNLRGGLGLWVPPGGHVDISIQQPASRLREKIREETGFDSDIVDLFPKFLPSNTDDLESRSCTWMTPPPFLLREDLMGACSQGHLIHLDLCYMCSSDGIVRVTRPKYDETQRIEIPVSDCVASFHQAEVAVGNAIDDWYRRYHGRTQGLRDDLTRDVVWRLHLAAKYFAGAAF